MKKNVLLRLLLNRISKGYAPADNFVSVITYYRNIQTSPVL